MWTGHFIQNQDLAGNSKYKVMFEFNLYITMINNEYKDFISGILIFY